MTEKKIAIVGTASTSNMDAPYNDPSWEIWTLGRNLGAVPRFDLYFELHELQCLKEAKFDPAYFEEIKKLGDKLVLGHKWEGYPEAQLFPKDEIVNEFGRYYTSSIALLLALAIKRGATKIGLWGVDMTATDEYGWQKACCEYYLGLAAGRGIDLVIAKESPLIRIPRIYGLEENGFSAELEARYQELVVEIKKLDDEIKQRTKSQQQLSGMLELIKDLKTRWG